MTVLRAVQNPRVRPVPWRALAWVAWRNHRGSLVAILGGLGLLAAYLVIQGLAMRSTHHAYQSCLALTPTGCQAQWEAFRDGYGQHGLLAMIVMLVPGLIGVFTGTPVFAREFESGTFRYTWTQGSGRMRWAVAMLTTGVTGTAIVAGAFAVMVQWHQQPLLDSDLLQRDQATLFPATGVAATGWAVTGFALGAVAGLLLRRSVPALAVGFVAWFCLAFVTGTALRQQYLAPQADIRYWPAQWIEFGWLAALTIALIAGTLWLLHHRPS